MKSIFLIKRRLLKKLLVILGVCSAGLMTSCAKYGALVSTFYMNLKGTVKSKESSQVISGIKVEVINGIQNSNGITDTNGAFSINAEIDDVDNTVNLHVSDIDGALNGSYLSKDTIITLSTNEKLAQLKETIDIKLIKDE
jgi:putative lipoprotein (rSAM/lipoprotein system)